MHPDTFEYQKPTDLQQDQMKEARAAFTEVGKKLDSLLPEGPDKTYVMRKLRETAMWANVAITKNPDGSSRY